jgi:hypothetical protein
MRRIKVATYIRNEIAQYSEVSMKINFNKFTDRQIKNIHRQLKNGAVSYGHSATTTIAKWLLKKYPMPHFKYDSWYIRWQDLPNGHPFFSKLKDIAALTKLQSDLSEWERNNLDETIKTAHENTPTDDVRAYKFDKHDVKKLKKTMKVDVVLDDELKDFLDKMERRELGVIDVNFYDFADSY